MKSDLVDLEVQFRHQTSEALLIALDEDSEGIWLPKSQCSFEPTSKAGIIEITLPRWLAEKKGLV